MRTALVVALVAAPAYAAGPLRHVEDAPLRAVQFVDANEGWAVGDEGVVWHTIDGGATWERQPSGVTASLRAIHFVTPYQGYIVGREELPFNGGSTGVVLVTADGGLKWTRLATNALPGLCAVKFFDNRTGLVAGDGSDRYGSGVFATSDGGRTWKPQPGPRTPGWRAADFSDPKTGALAGAWSSLAVMRDSMFGKTEIDELGGRSVLGLKLTGNQAVAVGQGGLVLISPDTAGVRWSVPSKLENALSQVALTNCDFNAVAVAGEHIWVAGRPGTIVLHSADHGRTWESFPTGQSLPINGLCFLDNRSGWAVGEFGTILVTSDGGRTWKPQQRGGQRAAALFVTASAEALPLDVLTMIGGEDLYLTAALRVVSADPASSPVRKAADAPRWAAAVRHVGGGCGECLWQFPLPDHLTQAEPAELIAHWNTKHGNRAGEMMLRQLVLALRMWQPEVVLTTDGGAESLVLAAVKEAIKQAADPAMFPEQIQYLGLKPWEAKKLYAGGRGPAVVASAEPLGRLGDSARDIAEPATGLLTDRPIALPSERRFELIEHKVECNPADPNLMGGVVLAHGGTARREMPQLTDAEIHAARAREAASRTARTIEALNKPEFSGVAGSERLLAALGSALKKLPADRGAVAAFGAASQLARSGQWALAREAFLLMVDRYPADPLSVEAYRWLAAFGASSEARRRHELGQFVVTTTGEVQRASAQGDPRVKIQGNTEMVMTQTLTPLGNMLEARAWYQSALATEPRLAAFGPLYAGDPAFQMIVHAARRNLGDYEASRVWCQKYLADSTAANGDAPDVWREAAAAELWLTNRTTNPPRPVGTCRQTTAKPYLDGKLDDDCWKAATPMVLRSAVGGLGKEYTTKAYFAYDAEFLYVAVQCEHPATKPLPAETGRAHDADLRAHDRVGILLDLDRDFQTYFHLQVDCRGCLAEDCWGDKTWNPKWFVAVHPEETRWTVEIAIPRPELTGDPISVGKVWAANVTRTVPGRGVMGWSLPAGVEPRPEGMGLLMFSQ